jgi:hypothetical protein
LQIEDGFTQFSPNVFGKALQNSSRLRVESRRLHSVSVSDMGHAVKRVTVAGLSLSRASVQVTEFSADWLAPTEPPRSAHLDEPDAAVEVAEVGIDVVDDLNF